MGAIMGAANSADRLALRGGAAPKQVAAQECMDRAAMAERFVETIAETCNVTLAAQAIGRSMTNVYRQRARDASFRHRWDQALAIGYLRLEMMLLERALHGVEKVVVAKDGTSATMRDYPDRVALTLLRMHRERAATTEQGVDAQACDEARERVMARIARLRTRMGIKGQGAAPRRGAR